MSLPVAILAGGLATRLRPITAKIPKALVSVAGKPFLAQQLNLLHEQGIHEVVVCIGHLGEMVQAAIPDGTPWGMKLRYVFDGPQLLGTGGALRQALPYLGAAFFVLYGDSYLPTNYQAIAASFANSGKAGLMTVYRNEGRWDTSNVVYRNRQIIAYDKRQRLSDMRYIDYGLGVLTPGAFAGLEQAVPLDLTVIYQQLIVTGELAGYEVQERFFEIGSPAGLAELEDLLA